MVQRRKMPNYGLNRSLDFKTLFERSLSKLSENHKNVEIGSSKLKLWLLKGVQLDPRGPHPFNQWLQNSFNHHNLSSVYPISLLLWFSESLEKDLSNGTINSHNYKSLLTSSVSYTRRISSLFVVSNFPSSCVLRPVTSSSIRGYSIVTRQSPGR